MKIAVIGSGIAGLSAAYLLSRQADVCVTLLEKHDRIGMDSHRLDLNIGGERLRVDVPSRMFNAAHWPELVRLYDRLGLAYQPVDPRQSFSSFIGGGDRGAHTYLKLQVAFQPGNAIRQFLREKPRKLLAEATRLTKQGRADLASGIDESLTLGEYLSERDYSAAFRDEFLYPTLSSTVCTCSYSSLDRYPAWIVLTALRQITDDRELMRTSFGTRDVVARLSSDLPDVRTRTSVQTIALCGDAVQLGFQGGRMEMFDHVIVATQANTALLFLPEVADDDREVLESIEYEHVPVVVHRDSRLMPAKTADWCTFNMGIDRGHSAMCTVWLNRFYDWDASENVFQTISPLFPPERSQVLSEIQLQRPVVNARSVGALDLLQRIHQQPGRRIWYCGSWAAKGIPLLETGVVSADRVVGAILATPSKSLP
jgi:predicted NAD/FAD-binding protein